MIKVKNIQHSFTIKAAPETLYRALTLGQEIAQWWTSDVELAPTVGSKGLFRWRDYGYEVEVVVEALTPSKEVRWACTRSNMQGTSAWVGSKISFQIKATAPTQSELIFTQSPYSEESSCYQTCVDGWNYFLGKSLKSYLEEGKGAPYRPS